MKVTATIEDADGTNSIYIYEVIWNYNGNSVNGLLVQQHTGAGTYNGTDIVFAKVGNDVVIQFPVPAENNNYRVVYELY